MDVSELPVERFQVVFSAERLPVTIEATDFSVDDAGELRAYRQRDLVFAAARGLWLFIRRLAPVEEKPAEALDCVLQWE